MGFAVLIVLYAVGALGSLVFHKHNKIANVWQSFFGIIVACWGIIFSIGAFVLPTNLVFTADWSIFPLLNFSFNLDKLSTFFIFTISLVTLFCSIYGLGYIKHFYKKYDIGLLGFFYHLFIVGMLLVVSASNGLLFLVAWEIMSIASYFLVVYDRNEPDNIKAGFLYLVMTHIGTTFIILALLLMYRFTSSFDFLVIKASADLIPATFKNIIFVLSLVGFGTKAGIIPFHIWLPSAHPAAPSHVSALMSGVMIKTGVYMIIRLFFDMLPPTQLWWGVVVLIIGAVSAVLGVLYALTEHDIKRLLAYHSIENIGIILLGLGSALIFLVLGNLPVALFSLGAALFHILNHAIFKSLLFLSAGSVINQTHTRNMEKYGGLIKRLPRTALFFLIGSMAISALPPFNGFFSEWMTFQSLLVGLASTSILLKSVFIFATISLAVTGGLALACFVKAFAITFLARPRSSEATHAKESDLALSVAMGSLAVICLFFGLFSGYLSSWFLAIASSLQSLVVTTVYPISDKLVTPSGSGSVSALLFFIIFVGTALVVVILIKYIINQNQKIKIGATWDCGVNLGSRTEITATGFARSIVLIFAGILRPSTQQDIEYHDSEIRYLPKSKIINFSTDDVYRSYIYQPLKKGIAVLALSAKNIQSGNINIYVFYILIALIVASLLV